MSFFVSEEALGGEGMSRRALRADIAALTDKLDAEEERRDALLADLRRTERAIERFQALLDDLGADA